MNYPKIAFGKASRLLQEKYGSRKAYENVEQNVSRAGLSRREVELIRERDSFYIASIGENGYPYIQHRGGPKGFLKVLKPDLLGFLDFSGNKQYITVGNLQTQNKVSLILVDYPRQARLKVYAEAEIVALNERPDLIKLLDPGNYNFKSERIIPYNVKAFDWNCPQHITPRYTLEDFREVFGDSDEKI